MPRRLISGIVASIIASALWMGGCTFVEGAGDGPSLGDIPRLIHQLDDKTETVRRGAARELGSIGPDAMEAVPALLRALEDDIRAVRLAAAHALMSIDPDQAEAVARMLGKELMDGDSKTRLEIVGELRDSDFSEHLKGLTAAIAFRLRDEDPKMRAEACIALEYNRIDADAVTALVQALGSQDDNVRATVARTLGGLGPAAKKEARAALAAVLQDKQAAVRADAAAALQQIDPGAKEAWAVLLDSLTADDRTACLTAVGAILTVEGDNPRALKCFARLLDDPDSHKARAPVSLLYGVAENGGNVVPALRLALKSEDKEVLIVAASVARDLGPRVKAAAPALTSVLRRKHKDFNVNTNTAHALGKIGPEAGDDAKSALFSLLEKEYPIPQEAAAAVLNIDPGNRQATDWFATTLKHPSPLARMNLGYCLAGVNPLPEPLIPILGNLVKRDGSPAVRRAATRALGNARDGRNTAVPFLAVALGDSAEERTREWAAEALGGFGADAEAALPALKKALKDDNRDVREAVAVALGRIGGASKECVNDLLEVVRDDPSGAVRAAAASAFGSIGDDSDRVISGLTGASKEKDKRVRLAAVEALERLHH